MITPLRPDEISDRIEALRSVLTPTQTFRLTTIKDLVGGGGRFQLRAALDAGDFPSGDAKAQDAFQDFRHKVNTAAERAGVDLRLELDSHKTSPDTRHGWFAGNPVEKGLVAYTAGLSERTDVARPVAPEVAELGDSRRLRVYVSFYPTTGTTMRRAGQIIKQLSDALYVTSGYVFEVGSPRSIGVGEDATKAPDRLSAEADVRVALISNEYLGSGAERRRGLALPGRVIAFALSALPASEVDLSPLRRHEVSRLDKPWDHLKSASQRAEYINELVRQILMTVSRPSSGHVSRKDDDGSVLVTYMAERLYHRRQDESRHLVPSELAETSLQESRLDVVDKPSGPPLRAVDRLVAWATDRTRGAPRLCALLGDVGMGKTTTAKLFTQHLLELHRRDPAVPMPVLFDLRDVRVTGLTDAMTLDHILDSALDATRPAGIARERLDSSVVRKRLDQDVTVIVFDGLDEVLVHLAPHDRQLFTRQLWRVITEHSAARMLLTCRTQYFRTIRDEVTYFTGETRQGLRGGDYLALLMLPFRDEQVRAYLAGNLDRDEDWVDRFLETIAAVHDLPDLARRPITLRLIADQVEFIETAKLQGRTLRSVDIYSEVVERWLARDQGKHTLTPDHKRLLMEEIAAGLWRSGQNAWTPSEVDDWLLNLLDRRPDLRRHYRAHLPDLWTADFRTATFLKREGDTFQFGHRSLFEYFLARYLLRALSTTTSDGDLDVLALPVPNAETLDFLGQSIASTSDRERAAAVETLRRVGRSYLPDVSELALAYALHAHRRAYPHQSLNGVHLAGARLRSWKIGSEEHRLSMTGTDLTSADLRQAIFHNVDLTDADLTDADTTKAEFHSSTLMNSTWQRTNAIGTILRRCSIDNTDLSSAQLHRTQLLLCTPPPAPHAGLLIAPTTESTFTNPPRLNHFIGHAGWVQAAVWSPDGTRILTSSSSGSAQVWDAATGEQTLHLTKHTDSTRTVAWSPDGTHILTGGSSVRVWDAATGEQTLHLTKHTDSTRTVAWSPDGTHILTGSNSGSNSGSVHVWDAATGEQTLHLTKHTNWVSAAAWSPDGTHILTCSDSVRVWNAITGEQTLHLTKHTEPVQAVAWSPDGTHILTGSNNSGIDGAVRVWDAATGEQTLHLTKHTEPVQAVAWSPDGTHILTGSNNSGIDGAVRVWDAATGEQTLHLTKHTEPVQAVAWSPDGTHILTGSSRHGDSGGVRIWDAATGEQTLHLTDHTNWVRTVAWSADCTRILTGGGGSSNARIWDAATGEQTLHLTGHAGWVSAAAWSPDGTRILTGGGNSGSVWVWDAATGKQTLHLTGHAGWVSAAAWSPDGTRILTGSDSGGKSGSARVWNAVTGEQTLHLTKHTDSVQAAAWSPDGTHILTSSSRHGDSGGVRIWDAATGNQTLHLADYTDPVRTAAWSPDGTHILTCSDSDSVRVWNAITGKQTLRLTDHTDPASAAAWSPDGTCILTCSDSGINQVWDATTGEPYDFTIVHLTPDEVAVIDIKTNIILRCTSGAWRWLGWSVLQEGRVDRLPVETFGELTPVTPADAQTGA